MIRSRVALILATTLSLLAITPSLRAEAFPPPAERAAQVASLLPPPRVLFLNVSNQLTEPGVLTKSFSGFSPAPDGIELTETNLAKNVVVIDTSRLGQHLRRDDTDPRRWHLTGPIQASDVMGAYMAEVPHKRVSLGYQPPDYSAHVQTITNPAWGGRRVDRSNTAISSGPPTFVVTPDDDAYASIAALPTRKHELNVVVRGTPPEGFGGEWHGSGSEWLSHQVFYRSAKPLYEKWGQALVQRGLAEDELIMPHTLAAEILDHLEKHDPKGEVTSINLVASMAGHNPFDLSAPGGVGQRLANALSTLAVQRRITSAWPGYRNIGKYGLEVVARTCPDTQELHLGKFSSPAGDVIVPYSSFMAGEDGTLGTTVVYHAWHKEIVKNKSTHFFTREVMVDSWNGGHSNPSRKVANRFTDNPHFVVHPVVTAANSHPSRSTTSNPTTTKGEAGRPWSRLFVRPVNTSGTRPSPSR